MSNERGFAKIESRRGKTTRRAFGAQSNGKRQGFCGRATEPRGGVLVATDAAEVARDAVELLRGGGASLSGPPLERRRRAALRQAKPEDAAAQVVAILLTRSRSRNCGGRGRRSLGGEGPAPREGGAEGRAGAAGSRSRGVGCYSGKHRRHLSRRALRSVRILFTFLLLFGALFGSNADSPKKKLLAGFIYFRF
jgi:hypothetical protein